MNGKRTLKIGMLFMMLCLTLWGMGISAEASSGKYSGGIVLDENANPVQVQNGLMPSKGDVNALVIMVDFPDVEFDSAHTKEYVEEIFFGDSEEPFYGGLPTSLSKYYEYASYGQLNLSGDVYSYTAEQERDYYDRSDLELPGDDTLFKEVLTALDGQIDYSSYDSNKDGYIDGIYLFYAGGTTGWGTTFWTYMSSYINGDLVLDGTNLLQFIMMNETHSTSTVCHETGHLLGLMDYYDYEKGAYGGTDAFGGRSLMCDNTGDLDALSKIILGWIEPQKISGDEKVSLRPINEYGDAAIIYPSGDAQSRSFFLVESYSSEKNNFGGAIESGLRIYRVNTALEEDGNGFLYGVTDDNEINTVQVILDTIQTDKGLTPYAAPSSYLLEENSSGEAQWIATGISITDLVYGDSVGSFSVKYETMNDSVVPAYTINNVLTDNKIYVELDFDVEVKTVDEDVTVYAVSGEESIPMTLVRNNYSSNNLNSYYLYTNDGNCKPDTTYTITIPADVFVTTYGKKNTSITHSVKTTDFPAVIEVERDSSMTGMETELFAAQDGGVIYFCLVDSYLQKVEITSDGTKNMTALTQVGTFDNYDMTACCLENGEYIVHVHNGTEGYLYRIDGADNCTFISSVSGTSSVSKLYAMGNNAVILRNYGTKYYLVDENNTVTEGECPGYNSYYFLYSLWEDRYLAMEAYADTYYIVDSNMNIVKEIGNPGVNFMFFAAEYNDYLLMIGCGEYSDSNSSNLYLYYFDKKFKYAGKELLGEQAASRIMMFDGGFAVSSQIDRPFNNVDGEGWFSGVVSSPIANILIWDNNFNSLFSYTVDYGKENWGDSLTSMVRLSNGGFAFATDWHVYITESYAMETVTPAHPDMDKLITDGVTEPTPQELVESFVERMYTVALGRGYDAEGLAYWADQLLTHAIDGAGISQGFILSEEFEENNYSNQEYVEVLYKTFFDRESDASGCAYWMSELEAGKTRKSVLVGFVNSQEFSDLCELYGIIRGTMVDDDARYAGVQQFVERLYTVALGRASEESGLNYWTESILAGSCMPADAARAFFFSDEYQEKNASDEEYINTLYLTFMDRESDQGGKDFWLEAMNNGMTRQHMLDSFAQSDEFKEIMSRYGL